MTGEDSVAIVSGGLDSTTLVYDMVRKGYKPHVLSFDYDQRHAKEIEFAWRTARRLGRRFDIVNLSSWAPRLLNNSALTSSLMKVPEGHYTEESMKATVVPNRNMIMLSIAAACAINNKYRVIGFGAHAGDHPVYPDCRASFLHTLSEAILEASDFPEHFQRARFMIGSVFYKPFLTWHKGEIALEALRLGVPLHETWSCYKGGEKHCGRCGTCVERLEAIDWALAEWDRKGSPLRTSNKPSDNTEYEDTEYWRTCVEANLRPS